MASNVRTLLRQLVRASGFTLAVLAMLCLSIGANTAIFTVVNTVLLHPLPYPHSDRIVNISRPSAGTAIPMFKYWEQNNPGFEDLSAYQGGIGMNLEGGARPELLQVTKASRNYFRLFGAIPILGR